MGAAGLRSRSKGFQSSLSLLDFRSQPLEFFLIGGGPGRSGVEPFLQVLTGFARGCDRGAVFLALNRAKTFDFLLHLGLAEGENLFELGYETLRAGIARSSKPPELGFAVGVENDVSGIALDTELALELHVAGGIFRRNPDGVLGKIERHEKQIFGGIILPDGLGEDVFIHVDAPHAPVGAGEVEKDGKIFFPGCLQGRVIIHSPFAGLGAFESGFFRAERRWRKSGSEED